MRKFFSEVLGLVKLFPLTSYGIFLLLFLLFLELTNSFSVAEAMMPGLPLMLTLLAYPLKMLANFVGSLGLKWILNLFNPPLLGTCVFLFLLDLLILSLRTDSLKNFLKKTYKNFSPKNSHNPKS